MTSEITRASGLIGARTSPSPVTDAVTAAPCG
jgi:hypothetical protein